MYFNKNNLKPINESVKILFKNFITNFYRIAKELVIDLYSPIPYQTDPLTVMDDKLKMMFEEFNSNYYLSETVQNKLTKLIKKSEDGDLDGLTVLNIKEIDKFLHLKFNMKKTSKNPISHKYSIYTIYNFFYRLLLDNDWEILKQIDAFTVPCLICDNTYIVFISFDEKKIKKIFTLAADNMYDPECELKLIKLPFENEISQSEFRKK